MGRGDAGIARAPWVGMPDSEEGRQQVLAAFGAGYSVLRADDMESAVSLARDHPFAGCGGSLTVMAAVAP